MEIGGIGGAGGSGNQINDIIKELSQTSDIVEGIFRDLKEDVAKMDKQAIKRKIEVARKRIAKIKQKIENLKLGKLSGKAKKLEDDLRRAIGQAGLDIPKVPTDEGPGSVV